VPSSTEDGSRQAQTVWRIEHHAELPSTSDHVRERATAGEPEGLVVVADRQTAGRGRHGRGWISPVGNLYLTVLLRPSVAAPAAGGLALVAGLSLVQACLDLGAAPGALRLKWPNDLLSGDAKIAGILLEADTDRTGALAWVSVGIGVNVVQAPPVEGRTSAALAHLIEGIDPDRLRARLLERLAGNYASWQSQGMAQIVASWAEHALEPGTPILVKPGRSLLEGRYLGIDSDGALLVDVGQVMRVTTGEVLLAGEALAAQVRPA
jgi:BirA family biotin operon repressor/biotin-[acetyl-CoA-carboxylase] ligase